MVIQCGDLLDPVLGIWICEGGSVSGSGGDRRRMEELDVPSSASVPGPHIQVTTGSGSTL